jgi:glyoxylase-like metal-dependent hydrolase (beta-lactamase superfamily II)
MPARHGDALILHCSKNGNRGIIAIDGGPYPNPRFNPFIKEIEKHLPIDLMVATHFDDDHLVGIKRFIENLLNKKNCEKFGREYPYRVYLAEESEVDL